MPTHVPSYLPAFMSHAHADNNRCDPYYTTLTSRGVTCYYDRQNPQVGHRLDEALQRELERAKALIVMVSPASLGSFWVGEEIAMFYALMAKDRSRMLIPVKIAPCELPARLEARWWLDATHVSVDAVIDQLVHALETGAVPHQTGQPTAAVGPEYALVQQLGPQIEAAFAARDWPDVIRRTTFLISRARDVVPPDIYRMRGDALSAENERSEVREAYEDARKAYDAALALNQNDVPTLHGAARMRLTLYRPGEAVPLLQDALSLSGSKEQRVALLQDLALAQASLEQWQISAKTVAEGKRLASGDPIWENIPVPITLPRDRLTEGLVRMGYAGRKVGKIEVIVPPVVSVPAGEFLMGSGPKRDSVAAKESWAEREKPQHRLNLPAFQIGKFPLTVAEYACFVRAGQKQPDNWQQQLGKLDHPVVYVSWNDVVAYAAWLAKLAVQPWRLPTEAEWEKAARGSDGRIYPWGDSFDQARCNTNEGSKSTTTPVGSYPSGASPYGALDMAGNVWEWTSSLFKPYPYASTDGRENVNSTDNRVLRGGSWLGDSGLARAAFRFHNHPDNANGNNGVRLARAVPSS